MEIQSTPIFFVTKHFLLKTMSNIYFAFTSKDRDLAVKIANELKRLGHHLVLEIEEPVRLPHFRQKLMEALRAADGVVALLTSRSLESQYVISDLGAGRCMMEAGNHFLIPIIFDLAEIPSFVQDLFIAGYPANQPIAAIAVEIQKAINDHRRLYRAKESRQRRVFIGHGRSQMWRDLKDFLQDRLDLAWEEFNREPTAGLSTTERLSGMLGSSVFAFLVLTSEDIHEDGTLHARQNVVHEAGLFQGRLGFKRAIVLMEEGTEEFSNIVGLTQIRFPKGRIRAVFEDVRQVLEREGVIAEE